MPVHWRRRTTLRLPVTLSVLLITLNVALMVCWIILFAQLNAFGGLTIGVVAFALILVGLSIYTILTIKEARLRQRQANFVDSVTHELKTPIASLRLYLETLQMRPLTSDQRGRFYKTMSKELVRLDQLIDQLLEVGRLDHIARDTEPEDIALDTLIPRCVEMICNRHQLQAGDVVQFHMQPAVVRARRLVVEMIIMNLVDNAIKYGGQPPSINIQVHASRRDRAIVRIIDNGEGVPAGVSRKMFQMFYRGGSELERRTSGTGVGLHIVRTLVHSLKGKVRVHDRSDGRGSIFEVELPGQAQSCTS